MPGISGVDFVAVSGMAPPGYVPREASQSPFLSAS